MTEQAKFDVSIRCDICNIGSGYSDPREPWERSSRNPKPTYTCPSCLSAVKDAEEQRKYLSNADLGSCILRPIAGEDDPDNYHCDSFEEFIDILQDTIKKNGYADIIIFPMQNCYARFGSIKYNMDCSIIPNVDGYREFMQALPNAIQEILKQMGITSEHVG